MYVYSVCDVCVSVACMHAYGVNLVYVCACACMLCISGVYVCMYVSVCVYV